MPQRYQPMGRYRGKALITRYQASRKPHDVTSAQLSIVVWKILASSEERFVGVSEAETLTPYRLEDVGLQRGEICWRLGSRNWLHIVWKMSASSEEGFVGVSEAETDSISGRLSSLNRYWSLISISLVSVWEVNFVLFNSMLKYVIHRLMLAVV